jgi:hypothetical protein
MTPPNKKRRPSQSGVQSCESSYPGNSDVRLKNAIANLWSLIPKDEKFLPVGMENSRHDGQKISHTDKLKIATAYIRELEVKLARTKENMPHF